MKKIIPILLLVLLSLSLVAAITGTIGNARMILHAQLGDTIQKSILIKNINNESINIEMFPSGDLGNFTKITNPNFTLASGDELNVPFSIKVTKEGTTETKINVRFIPTNSSDKNGVGLSSQVVIITQNSSDIADNSNQDTTINQTSTTTNPTPTTPNPLTSLITENPILTFIIILAAIFIILLLILLILTIKRTKQKRVVNRFE